MVCGKIARDKASFVDYSITAHDCLCSEVPERTCQTQLFQLLSQLQGLLLQDVVYVFWQLVFASLLIGLQQFTFFLLTLQQQGLRVCFQEARLHGAPVSTHFVYQPVAQ